MYEADHEIRNIENALVGARLTRSYTAKRSENYEQWERVELWTGKVLTCLWDETKQAFMLIVAGRGEYLRLSAMAARLLLQNRYITDGEVTQSYAITLDAESEATANVYKLAGERVSVSCLLESGDELGAQREGRISSVSVDNAKGVATLLLDYEGRRGAVPVALDLAMAESLWSTGYAEARLELGAVKGLCLRRMDR